MKRFATSPALARWRPACGHDAGASLVMVMLMLTALALMVMSVARTAILAEKAGRNERDRQVAFEAAMAALGDAEFDISDTSSAARRPAFGPDGAAYFDEQCGRNHADVHAGLCQPVPAPGKPLWAVADLAAAAGAAAWSVPFGQFTGRFFAAGEGALPARAPRYLIERLQLRRLGESAAHDAARPLFRITAMGFGSRETTQVVLQQTFLLPPASAAAGQQGTGMADETLSSSRGAFMRDTSGTGANLSAAGVAAAARARQAGASPAWPALPVATSGPAAGGLSDLDMAGDGITRQVGFDGGSRIGSTGTSTSTNNSNSNSVGGAGSGAVSAGPAGEGAASGNLEENQTGFGNDGAVKTSCALAAQPDAGEQDAADPGEGQQAVTTSAQVRIAGQPARIRIRTDEGGLHVSRVKTAGAAPEAWLDFGTEDDIDFSLAAPLQKPLVARFHSRLSGTANAFSSSYFLVASSSISSALFLISLDRPAGMAWERGRNYFKLEALAPGALQTGRLGPPALVAGVSGAIEQIFAGDALGNLWQFDFTTPAGLLAEPAATTPRRLFQAADKDGSPQPVSARPAVAYGPGGYLLLFGTGQAERASIAPEDGQQSFYALLTASNGGQPSAQAGVPVNRSRLAQRFLQPVGTSKGSTPDPAGATQDHGAADSPALEMHGDAFVYGDDNGQKRGWFFDFYRGAQTAEQVVEEVLLAHGMLFFNSVIPAAAGCAGAGRSYALDVLSGLPRTLTSIGAHAAASLYARPRLLEPGLLAVAPDARPGTQGRQHYEVQFGPDSSAAGKPDTMSASAEYVPRAGRQSWREIINWNELHEE